MGKTPNCRSSCDRLWVSCVCSGMRSLSCNSSVKTASFSLTAVQNKSNIRSYQEKEKNQSYTNLLVLTFHLRKDVLEIKRQQICEDNLKYRTISTYLGLPCQKREWKNSVEVLTTMNALQWVCWKLFGLFLFAQDLWDIQYGGGGAGLWMNRRNSCS